MRLNARVRSHGACRWPNLHMMQTQNVNCSREAKKQ